MTRDASAVDFAPDLMTGDGEPTEIASGRAEYRDDDGDEYSGVH